MNFQFMLALSTLLICQLTLAGSFVPIIDLNTAKAPPKLPALIMGCEGECCGILKTNKALADIDVYDSPDNSAKKVGVIKRDEEFQDAEFFTKITKFGEFREGKKKVTVIVYLSEGNVLAWDGKKLDTLEINDTYKSPSTESWVRFKTKKGLLGWGKVPPKDGKELDYGWCG